MSDQEYPLYTSHPCIGPQCEHTPNEYDLCFICEDELIPKAPVMHLFYQFSEKTSNGFIGNICTRCQSSISDDGAWECVRARLHHFEYQAEKRDEEYRKLIIHVEALKQHIDWLESELRTTEQQRNYYRGQETRLSSFMRGNKFWKRLSREEAYIAYSQKKKTKEKEQTAPQKQLPPANLNNNSKQKGYIYLVASLEGHYKIGRSKDVPTRVNTLSIQLPFRVELLHSFSADDYVRAEQIIHERFSHLRLNGEWFRLGEEEIEWFRSLNTFEEAGI